MQYKTTIEVVTEASNKHEATDIVGEFLRGDIGAGADLKVKTVSVIKSRGIKAALIVCLTLAVFSAVLIGNQIYYKIAKVDEKPVTSYAIQPPLKTNLSDVQGKTFKEAWEKEHKDRVNSLAR